MQEIVKSGYCRIKTSSDSDYHREHGFVEGNIAYLYVNLEDEQYEVKADDMTLTFSFDNEDSIKEFKDLIEILPNGGVEEYNQAIAAINTELSNVDLQLQEAQAKALNFRPHIEIGSGELRTEELSDSTAIQTTTTSMTTAKAAVAGVRNQVMKINKTMLQKSNDLKALLKLQTHALALKAEEMTKSLKKMEEAIWTINLYLGKDEQIHILRKGKPAPVNEKIVIRQNVLFMDEECALYADDDGIDIEKIEDFDDWLLADPKNLNQVIPDTKGILALHTKRLKKEYTNPWESAIKNDANLNWTYFLIRNGENLYRVYVDINAGHHLLPSASEFTDLFWKETYNRETKEYDREPLKPGSKDYMKALDRSEARRSHYLRIVLVLQGLMDRTIIFKPMPTDQINLCDPKHCQEWLHLIYESENIITDGKPTFSEWQDTINDQLEIGHRIIGHFGYDMRGGKYEDSRLFPTNAALPGSNVLHTIDLKEEKERYVFRYVREEEIYVPPTGWRSRSEYRKPTVRARAWVRKKDNFILNFDAATVEEMEYYQSHRLSRKSYRNMMPLLEAAIKLKHKEKTDEEPFRMLLVGELIKRYGIDQITAEEKIDELIKWWKFKNRTHRALLSEDTKAISMISDEYGLRTKQEQVRDRAKTAHDLLIRVIGAQTPAPILIAHKSDNQYVAYVPHNSDNVWVIEQLWIHNRTTGMISMKESKEWRLVDKRHIRWSVIYKDDRWDTWVINPKITTVLTDDELQGAIAFAAEKLAIQPPKPKKKKKDDDDEDEDEGAAQRFAPMCAFYNSKFEITLWYSDLHPVIPSELVITNRLEEPRVRYVEIAWKRTKDGIGYRLDDHRTYSHSMWDKESDRPWNKWGDEHRRKIQMWQENIDMVIKECQLVKEHRKLVRQLSSQYDYVEEAVSKLMNEQLENKARYEFNQEHGDPELWEDHLKMLKLPKLSPDMLDNALKLLAERYINPVGMTLKEVYDRAAEFGLLKGRKDYWNKNPDDLPLPTDVPMDYIVPEPPPKEAIVPCDEDDEDE